MSSWKRATRWTAAILVASCAVAAGAYFAATLAPERLRREVERQLELATGAPCRIAVVRVAPGLPVEVTGRGLELWDGALRVDRVWARVSLAAALLGRVRLSRLELAGATLAIQGGDGTRPWPWAGAREPRAAAPTEDPEPQAAAPTEDPDPLAAAPTEDPDPLAHVLQDVAAAVLGAPRLADTVLLRDGRIEVDWQRAGGASRFLLEDIHAQLGHSRLRGDTTLVAQTRIRSGGAYRGLLEWQGTRSKQAELLVTVTATELDLAWLGEQAWPDAAGPRGWLSGVADLEAPARDEAVLELDLVASDFEWRGADAAKPLLAASRVAARGRAELDPRQLTLRGARVQAGPLELRIDSSLARPFGPEATLALELGNEGLDLDDLRELIGSMPAAWAEGARDALSIAQGGRVTSLALRSAGSLADWRRSVSPDSPSLPPGHELRARLEDLRIQLDEDDAIERVALEASWSGDRLELRKVRGERDGIALARLDLRLDGLSHLLASNLADRVPESDEVLLAGLPLLFKLFEPEDGSRLEPPQVEVRLSHLAHPAVFWPMRSVELGIERRGEVLVGTIHRATWAEVPLRGTLEWSVAPERLVARLVASAASDPPASPPVGEPPRTDPALQGAVWAAGEFAVGPIDTEVWAQRSALGRFRATRSKVRIDALQADLVPTGRLDASGELDLGQLDAIPYSVSFSAEALDADAVFEQAGLGDDLVSGHAELRGDLRGRYREGAHPFSGLSGQVDVTARDGHVRHDLPAVLALTLAGEGLSLGGDRENVRYRLCRARVELADGVARTEALEFDGPDVRLFGSGSLDLGRPPHPIDADVAVFLFRPVDRALGAVPLIGDLILGGAENLLAAYFRLEGPWNAPTARSEPLRTLNTGPMRLVTGLPGVVRRGIEALDGAIRGPGAESVAPPPPTPPNPGGSPLLPTPPNTGGSPPPPPTKGALP